MSQKKVLIDGVEYIPKGSVITEKSDYEKAVEVWDEFCRESGCNSPLPYFLPANDDEKNTNAFHMIKQIVKYENGGRLPDFSNTDQYKYYPWFKVDASSGFGLSYLVCDHWRTYSGVPVRLCSLKSDTAEELGKKYLAIYSILQK